MAEFKISPHLSVETAAMKNCSREIPTDYSDLSADGIYGLETVRRIIDQHRQIKLLLAEYQTLVSKDTQDLNAMIAAAKAIDQKIGNSMNV